MLQKIKNLLKFIGGVILPWILGNVDPNGAETSPPPATTSPQIANTGPTGVDADRAMDRVVSFLQIMWLFKKLCGENKEPKPLDISNFYEEVRVPFRGFQCTTCKKTIQKSVGGSHSYRTGTKRIWTPRV